MRAHFWFLAALFVAGCGSGAVSVLPEPFTRERADGKIPVKAELIRKQVRAELDGTPAGEAEVARWQTIETDYNQCRLSSARATSKEAEAVFAVCMSEKGYVYMSRIDAEQFHNDVAAEVRKEKNTTEEERKGALEKMKQHLLDNALLSSAALGNLSEVRRRLASGSNPNAARDDGISALMFASDHGNAEIAKMLLAAGANPNQFDNQGITALMRASFNGHVQIVKMLLASGASLHAVNLNGLTPLIFAARNGHAEVAKLLLEAGANPNAVSKSGETALASASAKGDAEVVKMLLAANANPNMDDKNGVTALVLASYKGHAEVAKLLLEAGANPNAADYKGRTALMSAALFEHTEVVKVLLDGGANPNLVDNNVVTALAQASVIGNVQIADMLLEAGANPNHRLKNGRNLMGLVLYHNNPAMVQLFQRYKDGVVAGASAKLPSNTNTAETVFEKVWRSVVVIKSGGKQGSGVVVRPNVVATNCHVLDGGKITVYKHDNRRASTDTLFAATIRKRDSDNDFCLLDVAGLWGIPAGIRKYDTLKIGETVYALGSPKGLDLSLSSGLISQLRQGGGERHIQTDAAISPGSSGGGLFDSEGNLIGITTAVHKDADAENIGYAIPADLAL